MVVPSPHPVSQGASLIPREPPVFEFENCRIASITSVAPIELREVKKDVETADQQIGSSNYINLVGDAHIERVAGAPLPAAEARF